MTWERYTSQITGLELISYTGNVFTPRSYCDDPLGGVYVAKEPVCKLLMAPLVQFVSTNIAWDISQSSSATGTISTYTIAFGGGGVSNITGAAWAGAKTGTVQYNATGAYTVTAYVTDTLSKQSKQVVQPILIVAKEQRVYIGTTDTGLFVMTPTAGPAASNTGLTGDNLKFRAAHLHPAYRALLPAQQHVWACTKSGVIYSTDGAATWNLITKATLGAPENDAGDNPAPGTNDLDQIDLCFDPQDARRVYVLRTTATRSWLYITTDYGITWTNTQVYI